jgi:hypothetical protein
MKIVLSVFALEFLPACYVTKFFPIGDVHAARRVLAVSLNTSHSSTLPVEAPSQHMQVQANIQSWET